VTTQTYDDLGRRTNKTIGEYGYSFDAGDRITSESINGTTRTYSYDDINQVTSDNGASLSYDKSGNRTMSGYTTDTGNRITSDGTWTYTYDDAGQMVKKSKGSSAETWVYSYDHAGQMTSASKSATDGGSVTDSVNYSFDAFGNRLQRQATSGSTTTTERFAYDGWDTAKPGAIGSEHFDVYADLNSSNSVTNRLLFGPSFDEPIARQDSSGLVAWYGTDQLGSVRTVFDNSGTVTGTRSYSGFGEITSESGSGLDRYAYTAREWDSAAGLQYSRARMYDPKIGRWTSEDPIGFAGGDSNLSRYVGNGPTLSTDPSGMVCVYKPTPDNKGFLVYDHNGSYIGLLKDIDGVTHVIRNGYLLPLDSVIATEDSWWNRPSDGTDWFNWFVANGKRIDAEKQTKAGDIGTFFGGTYDGAGKEAANLIKDMIGKVASDAAQELIDKYVGGAFLKLGVFLAGKGWKVLKDGAGKIIAVIDKSGKKIDKAQMTSALTEFHNSEFGNIKITGPGKNPIDTTKVISPSGGSPRGPGRVGDIPKKLLRKSAALHRQFQRTLLIKKPDSLHT
jgi:RHS repeat-associated protein